MKTITVEDLFPELTQPSIEIGGKDVPLRPVRIRDLVRIAAKHRGLVSAIYNGYNKIPADERAARVPGLIVEAVLRVGEEATGDLLDAGLGWEPGTAENVPFNAAQETRLLMKIVEISVPHNDLGKLMAEVESFLETFLGQMELEAEAGSD